MRGNFAKNCCGAAKAYRPSMRALAWALGWLFGYYLLAQYGVYLLPQTIARTTTLPEYLAMVQIVSVLLGVSALVFATRGDLALRKKFFPELVKEHEFAPSRALIALLLGPLAFLTAYGLGMYLAFDALLLELAARGARAVQAQTGELGRTAQADTLAAILPFTVLIAPLGEEVLFRGGIYGGIQALVDERAARTSRANAPPPSFRGAGLPENQSLRTSAVGNWLDRGGFALLGSSLCFGLLHADTDGGMGIVRVVSASLLGLFCGVARTTSGSLIAPLALHATYNLISLATIRGWLVSDAFPTKYTIPTSLVPMAFVGVAAALVVYFKAKRNPTESRQS